MSAQKSFVVLSGPSGVGKGSLRKAVERIQPLLVQTRPMLYTSRDPRSGELDGKDYHFRSPEFIQNLKQDPRYVVAKVRSDWQAIDLDEVHNLLAANASVFAEVYYTFGDTLRQKAMSMNVPLRSVFLLPMKPTAQPEVVVAEMCFRLARRGTDDWEKIKERATSSTTEIVAARSYTHRLVNRVGEDDVAQWGECGVCMGIKGNRCIKRLEDLGANAKWLVERFIEICEGRMQAMQQDEYLDFPSTHEA